MLKQLLLLSLFGLSQGFRLNQGFTPLVKNLYYPYIPEQQQSVVTSYALPSSAIPLRFWRSFCMVSNRDMASAWDAFDMDKNGLISQNEIAAASMCPFGFEPFRKRKAPKKPVSQYIAETEPNCNWIEGDNGPSQMGMYIFWRSSIEQFGGGYLGMEKMAGKLLDLFHATDFNNDNSLDMNEFWTFSSHLWDSLEFYLYSTRNPADEQDLTYDKISQLEWDCPAQEILSSSCNPSEAQQLLLSEMPGNNMDSDPNSLNLAEFKLVFNDLLLKAKNSPYFEGYCKNWAPPSLESFSPTDDGEPAIPIQA